MSSLFTDTVEDARLHSYYVLCYFSETEAHQSPIWIKAVIARPVKPVLPPLIANDPKKSAVPVSVQVFVQKHGLLNNDQPFWAH